jgi:hypothetical protein
MVMERANSREARGEGGVVDPASIRIGDLYCRCNKVRRVLAIWDEEHPCFVKPVPHVKVMWVVGKRKGRVSTMLLSQFAAWAEDKIDEERLPAHRAAIGDESPGRDG